MFGSFYASLPAGSRPSSVAPSPAPSAAETVRPKRKQVARACDWCRIHRVKCDTEQPCRNCRARGGECSNNGSLSQVRTLPRAIREIETLRQRIQELEESVESVRLESDSQKSMSRSPAPPQFSSSPSSVSQRSRKLSDGRQDDASPFRGLSRQNSSLTSLPLAPVSPGKHFHGPSSAESFLELINSHLRSSPEDAPNLTSSGSAPAPLFQQSWQAGGNVPFSGVELTRVQESYFIGLFCNSWHCCYNVLDDAGFRNHWKSLWITDAGTVSPSRKPSSLVDIVIGLGMQYASIVKPHDLSTRAQLDTQEVSVLSRWLYRRCQTIIMDDIEKPSLRTAQSQFLSVLYLDNTSRPATAYAMLAASLRTSEALGLHLEPSSEFAAAEQELRKRVWWSLTSYDINLCIRLGRPWGTSLGEATSTCSLPSDNVDRSVPALPTDLEDGVTALSYALHVSKLALAGRQSDSVGSLDESMQALQSWVEAVPDGLKTARREGGLPYSTDGTELEIDTFSPPWLQCQRLLLETQYHNLALTLCRSSIVFPEPGNSPTPPAQPTGQAPRNAELAARHAICVTQLLHQVMRESDMLNGWREPFNVQWNAAITLAGFIVAYPRGGDVTQAAHRALATSVQVLKTMGNFLVEVLRPIEAADNLAAQTERFVVNGSGTGIPGSAAIMMPEDFEFDFSHDAQDFPGFHDPVPGSNGMYKAWAL
ncbi:fungal-specific transcription factor domain-containing protein [Plectosphaerella plurivora]|uniref:Fungal-specific transcription factor domain-containing protein n=1 Tax=Plectosphaerella plurivora TaxID=936078 RepID=A0A9P8VGQ5_9PEZI|nr:fungal-specific transcription factor domain-containing protein [Plectosphaerella plurivora]